MVTARSLLQSSTHNTLQEEFWREYIGGTSLQLFEVIHRAIDLAKIDYPDKFLLERDRIAQTLFTPLSPPLINNNNKIEEEEEEEEDVHHHLKAATGHTTDREESSKQVDAVSECINDEERSSQRQPPTIQIRVKVGTEGLRRKQEIPPPPPQEQPVKAAGATMQQVSKRRPGSRIANLNEARNCKLVKSDHPVGLVKKEAVAGQHVMGETRRPNIGAPKIPKSSSRPDLPDQYPQLHRIPDGKTKLRPSVGTGLDYNVEKKLEATKRKMKEAYERADMTKRFRRTQLLDFSESAKLQCK